MDLLNEIKVLEFKLASSEEFRQKYHLTTEFYKEVEKEVNRMHHKFQPFMEAVGDKNLKRKLKVLHIAVDSFHKDLRKLAENYKKQTINEKKKEEEEMIMQSFPAMGI